MSKEKNDAINEESRSDSFIIGNEWNKTSKDCSFVADALGKFAIIKSCETFSYEDGHRKPVACKKQGYGCGVVSKFENTLNRYECDFKPDIDFEITPTVLTIADDIRVGCLAVYRSPSMTNDAEIVQFYDQVGTYLRHMKSDPSLSGIIYVGDPNTEASTLANSLESALMQKYALSNLIGNIATRAGSETQPDSCFAYFKCEKLVITAQVVGRIHHKMDHRAIRIYCQSKHVSPNKPIYKTVTYRKRKVHIKDEDISIRLRELFSVWQSKYKTLLYDVCLLYTSPSPRDS